MSGIAIDEQKMTEKLDQLFEDTWVDDYTKHLALFVGSILEEAG
jgi:hypothetical protein